jgi:hypothetical protein
MWEVRGSEAGRGSEAIDVDGAESAEVEISDTGSREVAEVNPRPPPPPPPCHYYTPYNSREAVQIFTLVYMNLHLLRSHTLGDQRLGQSKFVSIRDCKIKIKYIIEIFFLYIYIIKTKLIIKIILKIIR